MSAKWGIGYAIVTAIASGLFVSAISQADRFQVGLTDTPLPLPPYYSFGAKYRIEGELNFELAFEDGKVIGIELISETLRSEAPEATHQAIVYLIVSRTKRVLREWKTIVGGRFSTSLTIAMEADDSLLPEEVQYKIHYDDRGTPSRLWIRGSSDRRVLG